MSVVAVSYFKAHCLEIIDKLQKNQQPIVITKRNKPVAKIVSFQNEKTSIFDSLKNQAEIKSDIVKPIGDKWSAQDD